MKKYTFLTLVSLIFSANMTHSMQYPHYSRYVYNPANYKNMSLHMAVYLGDLAEVEKLLKIRINVNQQDENGNTPLHIAAGKGYVQIAQLLLTHGAQDITNYQSYSASDIATANPDRTIWKILTEHWINNMNKLL